MSETTELATAPQEPVLPWLRPDAPTFINAKTIHRLGILREENLGFLIEQITWKDGYEESFAIGATEEYRKWIACIIISHDPGFIAEYFQGEKPFLGMPSDPIDKIWHRHILDTLKYAPFCVRVAGKMIHHIPCTRKNLVAMQTPHTKIIYEAVFGEMPPLWAETNPFIARALADMQPKSGRNGCAECGAAQCGSGCGYH